MDFLRLGLALGTLAAAAEEDPTTCLSSRSRSVLRSGELNEAATPAIYTTKSSLMQLGIRDVYPRDGILGPQFNKRLESFAPCYSQSLLLADFKENHTLLWF
jgi:hypothetical protein